MLPNPRFSADLVTFREEILNGILHFLCSAFKIDLEIRCSQMIAKENNLKKVKFLREFKGSYFLIINVYCYQFKINI